MTEASERYRKVAAELTRRIAEVPADRWDQPTPCEGWVVRDVVQHVVDTSATFLGRVDVDLPPGPSVGDDPLAAWIAARDAVQAALDDPAVAQRTYDSPMGEMSFEQTCGMFGVGDALVHTWDIARATGGDERLDPAEVARMHAMMIPNDELMRGGTAFGPKVPVPDDADEQTQLLAFTGRDPAWQPPS